MEINLNLTPRDEESREQRPIEIVRFSLEEIKTHFQENMNSVMGQFIIAEEVIQAGKQEEGENIWRSQIVFLESAFDFFMHEITKYGLLKMFSGEWNKTDKYKNLLIRMELMEMAIAARDESDWFLTYVQEKYKGETMASSKAVRAQLKLLGIKEKDVADKAFYDITSRIKTTTQLEVALDNLFNRRNKIAHQLDREHATAERMPITKETVEDFIDKTQKIVDAIYEKILEKG